MPDLVRLFIRHYIGGFVAALVFVGGMLAFDVRGLRTLVMGDPIGLVAIIAFAVVMGLTFASIECAIAVMYAAGPPKDRD
ncbi:MAG: hypothetical protein ACWA5T_07680 [Parvularcula sp.]